MENRIKEEPIEVYFFESKIDIHVNEDVISEEIESPTLQMNIDGQQHLDATNAGANFRTESELAGEHPRDGDVKDHQNISDNARSNFSTLDSTGIDGKLPMVIWKQVDCDQRTLFESGQLLKDKEQNNSKGHFTLPLVETQVVTEVTSFNSNLMGHEETESSNKVNLYIDKGNILDNKLNDTTFPCRTCLKTNISCEHTQRESTLTDKKPYLCSVCDFRCSYPSFLKRHMKSHTGEKPYFCSICDTRFSRSHNLKHHMKIHSGEKPHLCSICGYRCLHAFALKTHMRIHTGEKPHLCTMCDYRSSHPSHLKSHMKTHTGEKPHLCSICGYKCLHASTLNSHMKTHTGEKPYLCSFCDYRSSRSSHLKSHIRTHTGEKPYLCSICGYRCSHSFTLNSHMKTHTGEKPYLCSLCDYRCSDSSSLKKHKITHTGEKPYLCSSCDFRCALSSNLKAHMKTHTGKKP